MDVILFVPLQQHSICGRSSKIDDSEKSQRMPYSVIPAKAGNQYFQLVTGRLDSDFRRNDNFLRDCLISFDRIV